MIAQDLVVAWVAKTPTPKKKRQRSKKMVDHPRKQCLAARLLDEIERRGGMTAQQIQRLVYSWAHPGGTFSPKHHRGWWTDPLYGTSTPGRSRPGLLPFFCEKKTPRGRWVRNKVDHEGQPYRVMSRQSKSKSAWTMAPASRLGNIIMTYAPGQIQSMIAGLP